MKSELKAKIIFSKTFFKNQKQKKNFKNSFTSFRKQNKIQNPLKGFNKNQKIVIFFRDVQQMAEPIPEMPEQISKIR